MYYSLKIKIVGAIKTSNCVTKSRLVFVALNIFFFLVRSRASMALMVVKVADTQFCPQRRRARFYM